MIKIYFDNILIDTGSYTNLANEYELFANEFTLGSVASNYFHLSVDKEKVNSIPNTIKIMNDDTSIAVLHADSVVENKYTYDFELTDALTLMEEVYDASPLIENSGKGYITLSELVQDICQKYNIELGTTNFYGADKEISWYDNEIHARTYISYVAELNGGYATIKGDGKLYFEKHNKNSSYTISTNDCDDFQIGEYHKITRVVYDTGVVNWTFGNENGDTIYLDTSNTFITSESDVEEIYNSINNFEFYTFEVGDCPINISVRAGDVITFINSDYVYSTIANYSISYFGNWSGNYKLDVLTNVKKETQTQSLDKKVKKISSRLDYDEGKLEIISEQTDKQNQKIAEVTQTVEEVNSKISDIADITISGENTNAKIDLTGINQSEPIRLVIRPIREDISYLYPNDDLYPSDNLYMTSRTIRFHNNTTGEDFDYELPDDLLYYDSENYDEFIFDYDGQSCVINKKVAYNSDGTIYVLDEMTTISYDFPKIVLTDGDYTVSILGYNTGYIFARLMTKNIYTTQFYTKAETDSEISQTAQEINLSVNSKLQNYSTTSEMNSAIKMSANAIELEVNKKVNSDEVIDTINNSNEIINSSKISLTNKNIDLTSDNITINSSNFSVDKSGKVTATAGEIGGFNLTSTNFSNNIDGDYEYSYGDLLACQACILDVEDNGMNSKAFTSYYKNILDTSEDGIINALDLLQIQKNNLGMYELHKNAKGKLLINSNNPKNCFSILDGNGDYAFQAGTAGATIREINAETIICASPDTYENNVIIIKGYDASILCKTLTCNVVNQTSLQSQKKNFEKYNGALEEINNIDIYKYNLKSEEDTTKKHLGFVIGDDFNYSKTITNDNNTGVDIYSMASLCLQAIKEQQKQIEELRKEINSLKGGK